MKTYICINKADRSKVYECRAESKEDLLERYDISEEYFDIEEKQ